VNAALTVVGLYRSARHNYFGHYGQPAGVEPMIALERAEFEAGRGIVGDRFHSEKPYQAGQVTFFAEETWARLCQELNCTDRQPDVFRRNVVVRGADLNALIGTTFVVQGVAFEGAEYCKPCFWMDQAFAPGTLQRLNAWNAGGLRARVLTSGTLGISISSPPRLQQSALR